MNILDAELEYWTDTRYANSPSVNILVDRVPSMDEYRYEWKETGNGRIYYAEVDGFVSFFFARGPYELMDYNFGTKQEPDHMKVPVSKQEDGYAGRHFVLTLKTGAIHVLRGPWSSNSAAVRSAGFPTCIEVSYTDDPEAWERGHTFYAGSVNRESMTEISKLLPTDDPMHTWAWVEGEYGGLMPGLIKSHGGKLAGRIYRLTEE